MSVKGMYGNRADAMTGNKANLGFREEPIERDAVPGQQGRSDCQ